MEIDWYAFWFKVQRPVSKHWTEGHTRLVLWGLIVVWTGILLTRG